MKQGCVAIVWLGAVGIDQAQTSDIEPQSFENSWVLAPEERRHLGVMKSLAVMPFVGDPVMAERWTPIFREMTDLRMVSPSDATRYEISDHGRIELARRIGAEFQVDCALFGNVAAQDPKKSFVGFKERSLQRLSLHLMSASGTLMWKTELPYTIVKGATHLDEGMVTKDLLTHIRVHVNELGLAELEAASMQAASQSSRDRPDDSMATPYGARASVMAISIYAAFALNEGALLSSRTSIKLPADEFFKCEQS
jgi:hypothetical protein